ncbi:MAG: ATP-dependent Clp protease adaptor ClpS [Vicinamibacterales bacterium]
MSGGASDMERPAQRPRNGASLSEGPEGTAASAAAPERQRMMAVHTQGQGLCGVYPFEVAETKVGTVVDLARGAGFPLRASMEKE